MEDLGKRIGIADAKLRRYFFLYGVAATLFIVMLVLCILVKEYAMSFENTAKNLEKIRLGLVRIEAATRDMKKSMVTIERVVPSKLFSESPERQLLSGLDDLKNSMRNSVINITDIATEGNKVILPITIRGHLTDYSLFVNDVGKLQAMRFPFMNIQGITIMKEAGSASESSREKTPGRIAYEITGELTTLSGESGAVREKRTVHLSPADH